jgi:phage terminase small subunit
MGRRILPKNDHAWRAELTDRQARFCEQYLIDLNATEAALRSGYGGKAQNRKSEREAASRLRAMPKIANAVAKLLERKPGMTRTMVVTELAAIAQSDISQYLELVDGRLIVKDPATLPKEALRAIRSMREHITERGHVTIEVQLWDKVAALGLLARATGLHVSRAEVSTDINVTVEDKV